MPALLDRADRESVPTPSGAPAVPPAGSAERPLAGPGPGPDQGVIEEARRRQRLRRVRIALGSLLAILGLGGLVWGLGGGGSSAQRAHAGEAGNSGAARGGLGATGFGVRLSPALDGGGYGWCVGVEQRAGVIGGGGCGALPMTSMPLVMHMSEGSVKTHEEAIVLLTTPQVASILVNGRRRVPTIALPGLPYGLRAARIVMPLRIRISAAGRPVFARPIEPTQVLLDVHGHPIAQGVTPKYAGLHLTSGRGPCLLRAGGLPGLQAEWSHVAAAIRPFPGKLIGRSFFSCIDTEYYLHNWPLDAAILLDAAHPGTPPAAIPGLTPVGGEHGYFNGPGDFKGELTATRVGNAWLVVAGGSGLDQRMEVLRHLTATVKL